MKIFFLKTIAFPVVAVFLFTALFGTYGQCSAESVTSPEKGAEQGFIELLPANADGLYSKHGWNHFGEGYFALDRQTGVLTAHSENGSGLLWYSARQFRDFVLELEYRVDNKDTNSGIFLRIPEMVTTNTYIYNSFEIQIFDNDRAGMKHFTGAIYDANPPTKRASRDPGQWNHFRITCRGLHITVELNGELVNDWKIKLSGKVETHWPKGYIGLQNYNGPLKVEFRKIRIKEL
jgi:3-keto-disaccharide hydrolase